MAKALHDHAVDVALTDWVAGRRLVGVMGGHALERGTAGLPGRGPPRAAAGRRPRGRHRRRPRRHGGREPRGVPGRLDPSSDDLHEALALLAAVPSFRPSVDAWVRAGFAVLDRFPGGGDTLGIPTWFYGHEPPNVLATAIAKYVRNAVRESVLLEVCHAGIVFLPGMAGTVQEVFQDACENYYADESSVAPMVLVGRTYWTETLPAWPLLETLARGRPMEPHVHLVDDVDEAADLFGS